MEFQGLTSLRLPNVTAAVAQWYIHVAFDRPVSGKSWVLSPTAPLQKRYKNGTICFLAWLSAYKVWLPFKPRSKYEMVFIRN